MQKYSKYASVVLRLGLSLVVLWFGVSQIIDNQEWVSFIPDWLPAVTGLSAERFVFINGLFETVTALLLFCGVYIRPIAFILFLHMLGIILEVGFNSIGVRDIGIAVGLLSVALYGADKSSVDSGAVSENS